MRNLTIKRTKSFVGCLAKMKIYIEDSEANDITIDGVTCRKLGELKNGEEKTFSVTEKKAKVFVIADALSKGFCNEYYELAAGGKDVYLSGKNKFNPASGNAFRFDGNDSESVRANRKKGTRKGAAVLAVSLAIGLLIGVVVGSCLIYSVKQNPRTFSYEELSITLTNSFKESEEVDLAFVYESRKIGVFGIKETLDTLGGIETVYDYGQLVLEVNERTDLELKTENGLTYFEYDFSNTNSDDPYHYYGFLYKSDEAFWLVQFVTLQKNADKYESDIKEFASSVTFS